MLVRMRLITIGLSFLAWWTNAQGQASDSPSDVPSSSPTFIIGSSSQLPTIPNDSTSEFPSAVPSRFVPIPTFSSDAPIALPTTSLQPAPAPIPAMPIAMPNVAPSIFQAPTIESCRSEADSIRSCYNGLSDARACDLCAAKAIPESATDCADLNNNLCGSLAECPCLECGAVVEGFLACAFAVTNGCSIDCSN